MRLLLKNGEFYQERERFTDAIYIEDGQIISVGEEARKKELLLDSSEVRDLNGRTAVPGFNDAHLHFYQTGISLYTVDLYGSTSLADVIERGKAYLSSTGGEGRSIVGRGFNQDYFPDKRLPEKQDLDEITRDKPVIFTRTCSHLAVTNSCALERLGIAKNSLPLVEGGQIDVDIEGEPTGIFRENAIRLLDPLYDEISVENILTCLRAAEKMALKEGLTSLQVNDIWLDNPEAELMEEAYRRFTADRPSIRIYHQIHAADPDTLKTRIQKGFDRGSGEFLKYGLLKLYADGSLGARTAFMRNPYHDDPTTRGIPTLSEEMLLTFITMAEENRLQTAIHVIGDGALDRVLSTYEKVLKNGNALRHGLIHVQITDRLLLERIKNLDLVVYAQPVFIHNDMHIVSDRVGPELASTSYAFGTMDRMGIKVAYSTDAPIEKLKVMDNIHCAVNRQDLNLFPQEGYHIKEAVDRFTAIDSYTVNSAYMSFEENKKGRLFPGYAADLAVLDSSVFDVDAKEIRNIKVDETFIDGVSVYKRVI